MSNCLDRILCGDRVIIGVRNFDGCEKPESRIYINDYKGVDLKTAAKVTSDELLTGNKALKECIHQAIKHVSSDVMDFINQRFRFNNIVETRQTDVNFSEEIIPASNSNRGRTLTRWRSELAKIYIEDVCIKPDADIVVDIYVEDGATIKKYESIALVGNKVNTVPIRYIADAEKVYVYFNQKDAGFYNCNNGDFKMGCRTCGGRSKGNQEFLIRGWNGADTTGKCYGVGVNASVRCYYEDIFCQLLPQLYFPIYYRSVIEFMDMRIYSSRVNNITTFGEDKAREIKKEAESLYQDKLKRVIDNSEPFLQSIKGDCIICNSMYHAQATP